MSNRAETNREVLMRYIPIADMIVATFGSSCEAVIHDLTDVKSSLIYINGSVTGREMGAPTTEVILKQLRQYGDDVEDMKGFTSRTRDGRFLKTSTSFIRNQEKKVIGFLGINFDITAFSMVSQIISEFAITRDMDQIDRTVPESYAKNIEEVFENLIENTLAEINVPIEKMTREEKIYFVQKLDDKGAFLIQGSVDRVTEVLGVSKQTIYNYLDESRSD